MLHPGNLTYQLGTSHTGTLPERSRCHWTVKADLTGLGCSSNSQKSSTDSHGVVGRCDGFPSPGADQILRSPSTPSSSAPVEHNPQAIVCSCSEYRCRDAYQPRARFGLRQSLSAGYRQVVEALGGGVGTLLGRLHLLSLIFLWLVPSGHCNPASVTGVPSTGRFGGWNLPTTSLPAPSTSTSPWLEDPHRLIRTPGEIVFGGLFPMHEHDPDNPEYPCGALKEEKGIQRLEAMLYALDLLNVNASILPNITIGSVILDTCSSETYALDKSMEFVRSYMNRDMSEYRCLTGPPPVYEPHKPITGVIGASFSTTSIMVANILRLFKIPQISYASTSTELSDKSRFEYFSRVVPPDNFQAQAIAEVVRRLGWKYVSTVAVEGDYGEKGIASFIHLAEMYGICVAVSEKILRNAKTEDYDRIVERLAHKQGARGVVMFADEDETRKMLAATVRANRIGYFLWIGSDSWGAKAYPVRDQEWAAEGAITILPKRVSLPGFDTYFKSLRPRMDGKACGNSSARNNIKGNRQINCRNPWFREFWSQHFKCRFENDVRARNKSLPICTGKEKMAAYEQEGLVPFVADAVYAMAMGVDAMVKETCGHGLGLCRRLRPAPPGKDLLRYIRNVSFVGLQQQQVRFNVDGDAYGSYNIYQYQKNGTKWDYVRIGEWSSTLILNLSMVRWKESTESLLIPRSICSSPCKTGYIRNFQDQCCWKCVPCREDAYVYNDTCVTCEPGYGPSPDKSVCWKLTAEHLTWDSPWAVVPLTFSALGVVATLFTTSVFLRFHATPVIMASGRELCYMLLFGILLCYLMSIPILAKPTPTACATLRLGLGMCLSICYAAIFTKTNRISRIFNRSVKGVKRPSYTSPKSQIVICSGLVSVQFIGALVWLLVEPPTTTEIYPYALTAILTCGISNLQLMLSLLYNMFLILLCTLYAFKTRKIPENFNEAKYIGFTMYSTCIVWLSFVAIYFGTNNDYKIQIASMSMCLNISASVALGCLFTPKVYLVIFQPYKNVRQAGNSSAAHMRAAAGRAMKFAHSSSQAPLQLPTSVASVQSVTSLNSRSSPGPNTQAPTPRPNGSQTTSYPADETSAS